MASSSYCFSVVSLVVLLPYVFGSPSASTKFIDGICQHVTDKAFCVQTLSTSPAASATSQLQAATDAISLVGSYAEKCMAFTEKAAKENPNMKKQFLESQDSFHLIVNSLKDAYYQASVGCTDNTKLVKFYIGKNTDKASNTTISMTLMLEKLDNIAVGATQAVGG